MCFTCRQQSNKPSLFLFQSNADCSTTTRQVLLTDCDGHLNLFAFDANRQFSRDLNSINMSDNKVHLKEWPLQASNCRRRSETHQQVTTVSDCQKKCHQFEGLWPAATTSECKFAIFLYPLDYSPCFKAANCKAALDSAVIGKNNIYQEDIFANNCSKVIFLLAISGSEIKSSLQFV